MIRFICRQIDVRDAVHLDNMPVDVKHQTFDFEIPLLEAWIREPERMNDHYTRRELVGIEIRQSPPTAGQKPGQDATTEPEPPAAAQPGDGTYDALSDQRRI